MIAITWPELLFVAGLAVILAAMFAAAWTEAINFPPRRPLPPQPPAAARPPAQEPSEEAAE